MTSEVRTHFRLQTSDFGSTQAEEFAQALQLRLELALEGAIARWRRFDEPQIGVELAVLDRHIAPPDDAIAPEERQRVVAELALARRRIRFEPVSPPPEDLEAAPIPDHRIEGRQQTDRVLRSGGRHALAGWPVPVESFDARMCKPLPGALQRVLQLAAPLRYGVPQPAHKARQARTGQRRVNADDHVDQRVDLRPARRRIEGPAGLVAHRIDADAAFAPRDTQH